MSALSAIMYREGKIRATNLTFIFWDLFYPLGYLLVFGVGMTQAMGMKPLAYRRRLQRLLPRGRARHGELRHRLEYRVVVLHGSRQRHLLRDADLSDEAMPNICSARACSTCCVSIAQAIVTVVLADIVLDVPIRWQVAAAAYRGGLHRHRRLVFLLCDLRAGHPRQRCVQHGDVGLLFHPAVRQLDVLPGRTAAHSACASCPGQIRSRGMSTCCATRRSASAIPQASGSRPQGFSLFTAAAFGGALFALNASGSWKGPLVVSRSRAASAVRRPPDPEALPATARSASSGSRA